MLHGFVLGIPSKQASVAQLEASLEVADASRDDLGHRRGVVAALYEELRTLAERVQREQVRHCEFSGGDGTCSTFLPTL